MARPRRRMAAAAVVAGCVAACSAPTTDATTDSTTASVVCAGLRTVNNDVVDDVNASVAGIATEQPGDRLPRIIEGVDAIEADLDRWAGEIDDLDLPDGDESVELRRQLHGGIAAARAELVDQRRLFEAGEQTVIDDEVQGVVGIWFNAVEKVVSSLEPEIFRFERREFKQAFLDEPECRNVVQQFVND